MKTAMFQKIKLPDVDAPVLFPMSILDAEQMADFQFNQPIKVTMTGVTKARSLPQLRWIHGLLTGVSEQIGDRYPKLNTLAKLKLHVKIAIRFIKEIITRPIKCPACGHVFEGEAVVAVRSFGYDDLSSQDEANQVFNDAKNECASLVGCHPDELDRMAKERARARI